MVDLLHLSGSRSFILNRFLLFWKILIYFFVYLLNIWRFIWLKLVCIHKECELLCPCIQIASPYYCISLFHFCTVLIALIVALFRYIAWLLIIHVIILCFDMHLEKVASCIEDVFI